MKKAADSEDLPNRGLSSTAKRGVRAPQNDMILQQKGILPARAWPTFCQKPLHRCRRARPAIAAATGSRSSPAPTGIDASHIAPYWEELRGQVGKLEGLRSVPVPADLKQSRSSSHFSVRAGAFNSDRLRYGRFLLLSVAGGKTVLLGALHPAVYSRHPPFVFQIANFGASVGWMVAFDCPPLSFNSELTPSPHEVKVANAMAGIQRGCGPLAVPVSPEMMARHRMSSAACILSSAQAATQANTVEEFHGLPLRAFKAALSAHLDFLVRAPLDGSSSSVKTVSAAQAEFAAWSSAQTFLGNDALEEAFGASWVARLERLVLDDSYGLPSARDLELRARAEAAKKEPEHGDFVYIDPSQVGVDSDGD